MPMLKNILNRGLALFGYQIDKYSADKAMTMNGALARCAKRGLTVNTVIDVGASDGRWTRDCLKYFPNANYLLIEAQEPHKENLERLKQEHTNVEYVLAAAGASEGKIFFDNSALFGGLASELPFSGSSIEVPVITIDKLIKDRGLPGPYLIKLDTHGFEVPILEGAAKTVSLSSLVIIEAYNYRLTDTSLRFFEMCNYMKSLGFLSIELVDFVLRELDSSFWQMDMFFIPETSNEFKVNSY